jgi:hypothetical protein
MIWGKKKVFAARCADVGHQFEVRGVRIPTPIAEGKMPDDQTRFLPALSQPLASLPPRNYIRMRAGAIVPWTPRRIVTGLWTRLQDAFAVFLPGVR